MAEFKVTTDRYGGRSFEDRPDRWSKGNNRNYGHDDRWSDNTSEGDRDNWSRGGNRGSNRGNRGFRGNKPRGRGYSRGPSNSYSFYKRGGSGSYRSRGRGRGGSYDPRARLDDDGDEVMGGDEETQNNRRYNPYGRPTRGSSRGNPYVKDNTRGRGSNSGAMQRLGLPIAGGSGEPEWYKVIIPWGKKADKDFILKGINSHMDVSFNPTHFHYDENTAVFYVNDGNTAHAIRGTTKKVTLPNGFKMTVIVKKSMPPSIPMGEKEIEKLKLCMSKRYDPTTKMLNLSSLHMDSDMMSENLYMALARNQVMSNVVKIIKEHIPEVVGLDLTSNKLNNMDHLANLVSHTPDMKMLNMAKNKITHVEELRKLGGWKLEVLDLQENPLCNKFSEQTAYVSAVRKVYPKVIKLDNNDLPPPITFDIEARTDLPKAKGSYFPNMDASVLTKFLKDYFSVYDSGDRSALGPAYHDSSTFSLSASYNGSLQFKQPPLARYFEESRNLTRSSVKDVGRNQRKLRLGNSIVAQLSLLPKTQHDPNSFVVDIQFVASQMVCFTVQGVFKEEEGKNDKPIIRAFSRTFVAIPAGPSLQIMNDMLTITNASPEQIQVAFKTPAPTPSSSPVPQTSPVNPFQSQSLTEIQQKMVASFMNESHMNSEFSMKCLAENEWNYEKAGQVFLKLQNDGKIPPEAFVK